MTDPRFYHLSGPFGLAQLAELAMASLPDGADRDRLFLGVAPLDSAGPDDVSFLDNKRYLPALAESAAGACVIEPALADRTPPSMALLLSDHPYKSYALVAQAFHGKPPFEAAIHPTALVDPSAAIGAGTSLGAYAVIGPGVEIGGDCQLGAHVVIERGVCVGDGTTIGPGATLSHCLIGRNCEIHAGARIGNRGFGFAMDPGGFVDIPQLGRVIVEDDVEIGANSTVDRGAGPDTVIGAGCKIDNLVQIGHNVRVGRACVLVGQCGIAGSTKLEDGVMLGGQAGVAGHLNLGKGARVAAHSAVMRDVAAGETVAGAPAMPIKDFFRLVAMWHRQLKLKKPKP